MWYPLSTQFIKWSAYWFWCWYNTHSQCCTRFETVCMLQLEWCWETPIYFVFLVHIRTIVHVRTYFATFSSFSSSVSSSPSLSHVLCLCRIFTSENSSINIFRNTARDQFAEDDDDEDDDCCRRRDVCGRRRVCERYVKERETNHV